MVVWYDRWDGDIVTGSIVEASFYPDKVFDASDFTDKDILYAMELPQAQFVYAKPIEREGFRITDLGNGSFMSQENDMVYEPYSRLIRNEILYKLNPEIVKNSDPWMLADLNLNMADQWFLAMKVPSDYVVGIENIMGQDIEITVQNIDLNTISALRKWKPEAVDKYKRFLITFADFPDHGFDTPRYDEWDDLTEDQKRWYNAVRLRDAWRW